MPCRHRGCLAPHTTSCRQASQPCRAHTHILNIGVGHHLWQAHPHGRRRRTSPSHTACVPARRGRKSRDGHTLFCDCLAGAANNPEKRDGFLGKQTGAIPGLILASDWITVVPSGRIASRQRERLAISAAPPGQSRRGGRAQVTVGRDCPSACTRANPAYQTAAYRTAPVPVTDDPLATRPHAPPRPLG